MRLLITGSRNASPAMIDYAQRAVQRACELGWEIVVGDAPGVDSAVIEECARLGVTCRVWGANGEVRPCASGPTIIKRYGMGNYLRRDEYMARIVDRVLAVWDGKSRGTKHTFTYAQRLGARVDVRVFRA